MPVHGVCGDIRKVLGVLTVCFQHGDEASGLSLHADACPDEAGALKPCKLAK